MAQPDSCGRCWGHRTAVVPALSQRNRLVDGRGCTRGWRSALCGGRSIARRYRAESRDSKENIVTALAVSNLVLWLVVIGLSVALLAVVRQLGVLHERIAPVGALMLSKGLKVGESATKLSVQ